MVYGYTAPAAAHTGHIRMVSWKLVLAATAAFCTGYILIPLGGASLKNFSNTTGCVMAAAGPLIGILVLFLQVMLYKKSFRRAMLELGFRRFPVKMLLWGLPLAALLTLLGGAVTLIWGYIGSKLNWDLGVPPTIEAAMSENTAEVAALLVTALLAAPVFEEIFFRRVLYGAFLKVFPHSISAFIASLIFAATHMSLLQLPGLLTLSFIWQNFYANSRTLWTTIVLHFFNNTVAAGMLLLMRCYANDIVTY